jgi:hypothetical protein
MIMPAHNRRLAANAIKIFGSAGLACLVAGCMTVQLVANYDEAIDAGATKLQHKMSEFFVGLQSAEPEGRTFRANQAFYMSAAADLDALQVRAAAIRKNEITAEQLQLVENNLALQALMHKKCLASPTITREQQEAIRENGVDASLSCRTAFGASSDLPNRGDQQINAASLSNLKGQFESSLGAVVALEVAKKRGAKE